MMTETEIRLAAPSFPRLGESLLFMNDEGEDIVTTRLIEIRRPSKEALQYYVSV